MRFEMTKPREAFRPLLWIRYTTKNRPDLRCPVRKARSNAASPHKRRLAGNAKAVIATLLASDGESGASLGPASIDDRATGLGSHANAKPVRSLATGD
jgi:hypothetical protein